MASVMVLSSASLLDPSWHPAKASVRRKRPMQGIGIDAQRKLALLAGDIPRRPVLRTAAMQYPEPAVSCGGICLSPACHRGLAILVPCRHARLVRTLRRKMLISTNIASSPRLTKSETISLFGGPMEATFKEAVATYLT